MQETIYSVSQAVRLLDVQSHVLRYWEEEMKLPIKRNEMGHRYYTRWDIQVFLGIKELKKKGYSLKEIGDLIPFFYRGQAVKGEPETKKKTEKKTETKIPPGKTKISPEFMEIIDRIVRERVKEKNSEEARYKRLDERIRSLQQSRREVAAAADKKGGKKKGIFKKRTSRTLAAK